MNSYLVLTALGEDRSGIINELSAAILDCGCNIQESRMSTLGGEFAVLVLITGHWNTLAKLESLLPSLEQRLGLTIQSKRTEARQPKQNNVPYAIDVVSLDHPGIVHNLANFFSSRDINIEELVTSSYSAAHTGSTMFSVHMEMGIPNTIKIAELREMFMDYCDDLNLDAVMEPMK